MEKNICDSCEEEKEVTNVEGHLLCSQCAEDVVRCGYCGAFLGLDYDELLADNFGRLIVPKLYLPGQITSLIFCNVEHLETYLKKYKEENC